MASQYVMIPSYGDGHWRAPVSTASLLPTTNNMLGDAVIAQDTGTIYVWNGTAWVAEAGGTGVASLNGLIGNLTLAAGANITITPSGGNTLTIASTGGGGSGTVSSVGLSDATGLFNISGSPVTSSGTLTLASLQSQSAAHFFAAPNGSNGAPTFRAIVAADIPTLNQNTTGSAASFTGSLAGDITGTQGATVLSATSNSTLTTLSALSLPFSQLSGQATLAQLPSIASNTVLGNVTGGSAVPTALSKAQLTTLVNAFTSSLSGAVPASGGGTTNFLRADGSFAAPPGSSYTFADSLVNTGGTITLVGDSASPGATKYYGTNGASTLGFYSIPATGVTSVALSDGSSTPIYNISGSPVTTTGTLTFTLATQSANTVLAGPTTGAAAQPAFRALVGADLPNPSSSTLGGIRSLASTSHEWINAISTSGIPSATQPAFTDISGSVAASQMPALTGDVTTSAGSVSTSLVATSNSTLTTLSGLTSAASLATVGTIGTGVWQGTTIAIAHGGTGQVTAAAAFSALSPITTTGDMIYSSSGTTNSRLAIGSTGNVLTVSGGVPTWAAPATAGTVTSVGMSVPAFLSVSGSPITSSGTLAVTLSGTALPILNGGTGQTTANAAFNALSPMTTGGDLIYGAGSGIATRLANGTAGQVLTSNGTTLAPSWTTLTSGGTVTSVALSDGSSSPIYSISGSPVTTSGTLTFSLSNQSANQIFAGPSSGSAAQPTFRGMVLADLPSIASTSVLGYQGASGSAHPTAINAYSIYGTSAKIGTTGAIVGTDNNGSIGVNQYQTSVTTTGLASGSLALLQSSTGIQIATGSTTGFKYYLPQANLYAATGFQFTFINNGSTGLSVYYQDTTTLLFVLVANQTAIVTCTGIGTSNGTWSYSYGTISAGTVTSVGLADSTGLFTITGSPVTTAGTLTLSAFASQAQNAVLAGPSSGGSGAASFRALASADIPNNAANTTGTAANITASSNSTLTTLSSLSLPGSQVTGNISGTASNITASSNSSLTTLSGLTTASSLASVGTITSGTWNGTTVAIAHGGTGATSLGSGAVSSNGTVLSSGTLSIANGGTGATSLGSGAVSSNGTVLSSGTLSIANGGTGQTSAAAAFSALSPITTTGDMIYSSSGTTNSRLAIGSTNQILTVVGGVPTWATGASAPVVPTIQMFTSSSGTYTLPTGPTPLYIRVEMVGGGGQGGSGGNNNGGAGAATTFGTSLLSAGGGGGGLQNGNNGGAGGTSSLGSGPIGIALTGGGGNAGQPLTGFTIPGGNGGSSVFGGAGRGTNTVAGAAEAGAANTGGGGGGNYGSVSSGFGSSGGGGSGGYVNAIITSPSSTYAYVVGAGGSSGNGAVGGSGVIIVTEYYQ